MRLVLDTDVVVAAFRSPAGASAALLQMVDQGLASMLLSVALAMEYEAICQLPEHRLAAGLNAAETAIFVNTLIGIAEPVPIHFRWRPMLRDPGDEMVLEAAVNGRADALVSFNHRDYGDGPGMFGITVSSPREMLGRLRK